MKEGVWAVALADYAGRSSPLPNRATRRYPATDGCITNVPFPLQAATPLPNLHVPVIVALVNAPCRPSAGPTTAGEAIDIPNVPAAGEVPLGVNVAVGPYSPDPKHDPGRVKLKFVMFKEPPVPWVNVTKNWYAIDPSGFVRLAVQFPLMEAPPEVLLPHPAIVSPRTTRMVTAVALRIMPPM